MQIKLVPDMSIEPGHQVIVLPYSSDGLALLDLLTQGRDVPLKICVKSTDDIRIPHTEDVDKRIVELIDQLAHVRFSAPGLVQMTMVEVNKP